MSEPRTLYVINERQLQSFAFPRQWREAIEKMIDNDVLVPVEPYYEAAKIRLHEILEAAGVSVIVNSDLIVDAALGGTHE